MNQSPRRDPSFAGDRDVIFKVFFFVMFALLLVQMARLISPFLEALLGAAFLCASYHPVHTRVARALKLDDGEAALASTLSIIGIVVLPMLLLGWILVREASQLGPALQAWISKIHQGDARALLEDLPPSVASILARVQAPLAGVDIEGFLLRHANAAVEAITVYGTHAARNALFVLFNLLLLAMTLFYAFRDGPGLLRWALRLIPMATNHKAAVIDRVYQTFQAIVVGALVSASIQGVLATLGYLAAGVRMPFLLGAATTAVSLFPGSFVVTLPVSLTVFSYDKPRGLFLLVWCVGLVGVVDNFVKPVLIGSKARLPILLLFFGMLGAVRVYGFAGFLLGPILITAVLVFIDIYREEYVRRHWPSQGRLPAAPPAAP